MQYRRDIHMQKKQFAITSTGLHSVHPSARYKGLFIKGEVLDSLVAAIYVLYRHSYSSHANVAHLQHTRSHIQNRSEKSSQNGSPRAPRVALPLTRLGPEVHREGVGGGLIVMQKPVYPRSKTQMGQRPG